MRDPPSRGLAYVNWLPSYTQRIVMIRSGVCNVTVHVNLKCLGIVSFFEVLLHYGLVDQTAKNFFFLSLQFRAMAFAKFMFILTFM